MVNNFAIDHLSLRPEKGYLLVVVLRRHLELTLMPSPRTINNKSYYHYVRLLRGVLTA
jgi:hypothetical protein